MQLTKKQLKIQQRSDKTLSLWCIVKVSEVKYHYNWLHDEEEYEEKLLQCTWYSLWEDSDYPIQWCDECDYEIIWHPMTRWRLVWLWLKNWLKDVVVNEYNNMIDYMEKDINTFNQTVLEWSEDFQDLVIALLETLPKE